MSYTPDETLPDPWNLPNPWEGIPHVGDLISALQEALYDLSTEGSAGTSIEMIIALGE